MKNQGTMTPQTYYNSPNILYNPKDIDSCKLPNKELKITALRKLTEL